MLLLLLLLVWFPNKTQSHLPADGATGTLDEDVLAAADVKQRGRLEQGSCRNSSPLCIAAGVGNACQLASEICQGLDTVFGNGMVFVRGCVLCWFVSANPEVFRTFREKRQVQPLSAH